MGELNHVEPGNYGITRKADGNPEGKGLNGFLLDWYKSEPRGVAAKPWRQLLAEFFTSMLVLSATIKFRPVVGAAYYLYWIDDEWSLSLIAPDEWSNKRRAGFVGMCVLQRDMTWTIDPSDLLGEKDHLSDALGRFFDAFTETLDTDLAFEEILPFHVARIPYYQRIYANALSRSMQVAVRLGDQASTSCRQWYLQLPELRDGLLAYRG